MITQRLPSRVDRDATTPTRDNQSTPRAITVSESPVFETQWLGPAELPSRGGGRCRKTLSRISSSHPTRVRDF
jgi:hypothetical protein